MDTIKKDLKLYVWRNVLRDYTSGIAFTLASNRDEAYNAVRNSDLSDYNKGELLVNIPEEITELKLIWVFGGS
jgi:hypothetical protein